MKEKVTIHGRISLIEHPLERAIAYAAEKHEGQTDRDGQPHIVHAIVVMQKQVTMPRKVAAVLHDVPEDCGLELEEEIDYLFGHKTQYTVHLLTRPEGMSWNQHIRNVCKEEDAMYIKMADIEHNTSLERIDDRAAKKFHMYKQAYDRIANALCVEKLLPTLPQTVCT